MLVSKKKDAPAFFTYPLSIYFRIAKQSQSVTQLLRRSQRLQVRHYYRICRRVDGPLCSVDQNDKDDSSGSGLGGGSGSDSKSAFPDSPSHLVQSWMSNRSIAKTVDLSRRFISVLFLSNYCRRAAFAEKKLAKLAEEFCISRRLLILSAGLYSKPDDLIPLRVVSAARQREIDLSDERPCASFEITDLDYYDFVVVVDRNVRHKIIRMAEESAHDSGADLYSWERKIRLLRDFDGSRTSHDTLSPAIVRPDHVLDIPTFESPAGMDYSMDLISDGCKSVIQTLLDVGL